VNRYLSTLAAALVAAAGFAPAHDTWVQTNTNLVRTGDAVHIDLMLGNHGNDHRDFKLASKLSPDMIQTFEVIAPDGTVMPIGKSDQIVCSSEGSVDGYDLEHQIDAVNFVTRLRFEAQLAPKDDGNSRVAAAADRLVQHLLFVGELALTGQVKGSSPFAEEFEKRGPTDKKGRSLRQFELTTRLFKFPCSDFIYTETFDSLPADVKSLVYERLWRVLTTEPPSREFAYLTQADRRAIREILRDTKAGLPDYWR